MRFTQIAFAVTVLLGVLGVGGLYLRKDRSPPAVEATKADVHLDGGVAAIIDAGTQEPKLSDGWVDAVRGVPLRDAPGESSPALTTLEDQARLEVLEEQAAAPPATAALGRHSGRWLRVRAGDRVGWVEGAHIARGPIDVQIQGGLMLRSFDDTWSGDARTEFSAYRLRNGEWQPQPLPAVTDFTARAKLQDVDEDGQTDVVFSAACQQGQVTIVFSGPDGGMAIGPKLEGCEPGREPSCSGVPVLESVGPCAQTTVRVGQVTWRFSCTERAFVEAEHAFVTADALFVRERPEKAAPAVNMAPHGTRLELKATSGDWAELTIGGFVAVAFLSPEAPPAGAAPLVLIRRTSSCYVSQVESLTLSLGQASWSDSTGEEGGAEHQSLGTGPYTLTPSGLVADLTTASGGAWRLELVFVPPLWGFVRPEERERFTSGNGRIDPRKCALMVPAKCEYGDPYEEEQGFFCKQAAASP